jgi:UDP-2,3-diacylglucosamine pyrophosphatase LpxH
MTKNHAVKKMIKFIEKEDNEIPIFGDVLENQFFVTKEGYLGQKKNNNAATMIANAQGIPDCFYLNMNENDEIKRILSTIEKIEF